MDFAEFLESIVRVAHIRSRAGALGEAASMDEYVRRLMEDHRLVLPPLIASARLPKPRHSHDAFLILCVSILGLSKFLRENSFKSEVEVSLTASRECQFGVPGVA